MRTCEICGGYLEEGKECDSLYCRLNGAMETEQAEFDEMEE